MTKEKLFRLIYKHTKDASNWLDTVPREVNTAFFDNPYIENHLIMVDMLINEVFGEHTPSILWFLYDWEPGFVVRGSGCETDTVINNIEDYIKFMQDTEGFPRD